MGEFRPSFNDYTTERDFTARAKHAAEVDRMSRQASLEVNRRRSYELLRDSLPTLIANVVPSPVEVRTVSKIFGERNRGTQSGWPLQPVRVSWGESYSRPEGSRLDYFVITRNGLFGYANADTSRNAFVLDYAKKLNLRNVIDFDPYLQRERLGGPNTVTQPLLVDDPSLLEVSVQKLLQEV